ncbi:MAG TPA: hypothetical protein VII55_01350 [Candidatus Saccharimonadales bacterium]
MIHAPINAIAWSLGAIALYTFSFRSWRSYRRTKNPLAQMYYVLGTTFGTAMLFFGAPGLITQNPHILRYTYFTADFLVQISMQVQVWLLWFLGLRNQARLRTLLACTLPLSALSITLEVLTSNVTVSQSPHLIVYTDKTPVLILKSIIYLSIAIPLGYFFLRQVPHQTTPRAKIKSFMTGMFFIVVCLAATSNNIFDKGSDTVSSSTTIIVFFIIFLLAQLLRRASND